MSLSNQIYPVAKVLLVSSTARCYSIDCALDFLAILSDFSFDIKIPKKLIFNSHFEAHGLIIEASIDTGESWL